MPTPDDHDQAAARPPEGIILRLAEMALPLLPLAITAWLATLVPVVARGNSLAVRWEWVPSLNVSLSFHVDGLGLAFALLISGIGALILLYAQGYFGGHPDRWRLYGWLLVFMLAMLGVVTANNLILLFVFWELTSISSYMLIGFKHEKRDSRDAALKALLVTGMGGLALLAGFILLGFMAGSFQLTRILSADDELSVTALLIPAIVLILVGAFTKSAQVPFHFWLPGAMAAPTPVSAYLHSATMVKAGVYLVARLSPAFAGNPLWDYAIMLVGGLTMLTGAWLAIGQSDLKRILAYSTVSALGTLMFLLGLGTTLAVKAAAVFLIAHSLYKGGLFMVAGAIDHATGTRDVTKLSGLLKLSPVFGIAAMLAAASMAGLPPAAGFLAKEIVYDAGLKLDAYSVVAVAASFVGSMVFVAVAGLTGVMPFLGSKSEAVVSAHKVGWKLVVPPLVLSALGIAIGCIPAFFGDYFVNGVVGSILPEAGKIKLKLWHGFNTPLMLSVITLVAGTGILFFASPIRRLHVSLGTIAKFGPTAAYEQALKGLKAVASRQTRVLQSGRLRTYLLIVLLSFVTLIGIELANHITVPDRSDWLDIRPYELFVPVLMIAAAGMAVGTSSRMTAVCALGVVGFAIAMLFVMFGAPDLAMTQFAIETLTVVLFVFVIYRLPRFATLSGRMTRIRDGIVATIAGGMMTLVVLAATYAHAPSRLTEFFVENSYTVAKGKNMVNVILVDFREMDTLGEIIVIAVAALGIFALMRLRADDAESSKSNNHNDTNRDDMLRTESVETDNVTN